MKKLFIPVLFASVILMQSNSCKKDSTKSGCGCNSDTLIHSLDNTIGTLGYLDNQYQKGWFVNIKFPNNAAWICKICNIEKGQDIINTITQNDTVSVKVTGSLYKFCPDESIGFYTGIVIPYHIIIGSLKKN